MSIKLVALDLDGTTINNDKVISERNRTALQRAYDKGVNIVIATGRSYFSLPKDVFEIKAIRYVITSNGASVTDLKKKERIYENCMSPLATEKVVELLRRYDYELECFIKGVAYITGEHYRKVERTGKSYRDVDYILNTRTPVDDMYGFILENKGHIENININFEDMSKKPLMKEKLLKLPEVTITSSFPHNLEIGGVTTSKADAVLQTGRILGVEPQEMMAVGDSPNDLAMLSLVGFPVAVGNAVEEVKASAKYVAPTNDKDGVADAIERFVLNEEK